MEEEFDKCNFTNIQCRKIFRKMFEICNKPNIQKFRNNTCR